MEGLKYFFNEHVFTTAELKERVERQVAEAGDPEQWRDGEFDFDEWLIDAKAIGLVKEVDL